MHVVRCKCDREQAIGGDEPVSGVVVVEVVDDDARDFLECVGWRPDASGSWACPFCACGELDDEPDEEEGPLCDLCHREPASDEAVLAGLCEGCALTWCLAHDEGPDDGSN